MLEILYRIYRVRSEDEIQQLNDRDKEYYGIYPSISKVMNEEVLENVCICDDREQFKSMIRDIWGKDIRFTYSKKLKADDHYCVIIGEHCYDTEKYFNKIGFTCAYCGAKVTTYLKKHIQLSNWDIQNHLYNIEEYKNKCFCTEKCKHQYLENEQRKLQAERNDDVNTAMWVSQEMFHRDDISGYIYKISKKSTGEFYIGQTVHIPIFRWGQHLKTDRFYQDNINDYVFEVLEIVPKSKNILEVEKQYIQENYKKNPEKSLNISNTKNIDCRVELWKENA